MAPRERVGELLEPEEERLPVREALPRERVAGLPVRGRMAR